MDQKPEHPSWICIGAVGRQHGIRGQFFLAGRTALLGQDISDCVIGPEPERATRYKITSKSTSGGRDVLACVGISDREKATAIRGQLIWVRREVFAVDETEEYLWHDLVGKVVFDADGEPVGAVTDVYNTGASDILSLVREGGGATLDVPFVAQYFDMTFTSSSKDLRLLVSAETFADLWQEKRARREGSSGDPKSESASDRSFLVARRGLNPGEPQ